MGCYSWPKSFPHQRKKLGIPSLALLAWGNGFSKGPLPLKSADLLPRAVRIQSGAWVIEGPGENRLRLGPEWPDFDLIQQYIRERLVSLFLDDREDIRAKL